MERRRFLQLISAGAGALVLPGWLARAVAQDHDAGAPAPTTLTLATLAAAFRDAQRMGKPLLVVVVPDPAGASDGIGGLGMGQDAVGPATHALVEGIVGAKPDLMADLALAHVACARLAHLRLLVPGTPAGTPELVLVETDVVPARAAAITVTFPPPPAAPRNGRHAFGEGADELIESRVGAVAAALHDGLAPSRPALERRAAIARAHLDAATLARVDQAIAQHGPVDAALADRAAAIVALAADGAPPDVRTPLRAALAHAATTRLRDGEIPGSVWGTEGGCGPCGMGYIAPEDARFLHFFADRNYRSGF